MCICAQASATHILHRLFPAQLHYVDSVSQAISGNDRSTRKEKLNQFGKWAEENHDRQLSLLFRISSASLSIWQQKTEDTLLEHQLLDLVIAARNNELPEVEAKALHTIAQYWNSLQRNGLACSYELSAYELYRDMSPEQFPEKQKLLFELAGTYYRYNDNVAALRHYTEALQTEAADNRLRKTIQNSIGLCYRKMKMYDSAEHYFLLIYNAAKKDDDTAWEGIATGNVGITYFLKGNYEAAIPLIEKDIILSTQTKEIRNVIESKYMLSRIYMEKGMPGRADSILKDAIIQAENAKFWPNYPLAERMYRLQARIHAAHGNMAWAYRYADSALMAKDTNTIRNNITHVEQAKERIEVVKRQMASAETESRRHMQKTMRNGVAILFVMLSAMALVWGSRQRNKRKRLLAENDIRQKELRHAGEQLAFLKQCIIEKNTLIAGLRNEISQIANSSQSQRITAQIEQSSAIAESQWSILIKAFDRVHPEFKSKLLAAHPDITDIHIRYLILTVMQFSSREKAALMGLPHPDIQIMDASLRIKLGLEKDNTLDEWVERL